MDDCKIFRSSYSSALVGLTMVVIAYSSMESSNYLRSIQRRSQSLRQQLESSGLHSVPSVTRNLENVSWTATEGYFPRHNHTSTYFPQTQPQSPPSFQNDHPMCQRLAFPTTPDSSSSSLYNGNILNAGNLWHSHWERILEASYYPRFPENNTHILDETLQNVYRNLLLDLSPTHLEQGLLTQPKSEQVERVWNVLEQRRLHPETSPPLRILAMGGSVVEGVGCVQHQEGIEKDLVGRDCSWTARLEAFVNEMFGYDAVQIVNIAQGGTGTNQALSIVKYWMYPPQFEGKAPDIIIHAFGSNDSHLGEIPPTEKERILELHQQDTFRLNQFIQSVFASHPCPSPIVVHLDDYVGGHRQGALLGDFTYRMILKEVTGWYGNMAVSSAQVVDEFIYPDTMGETAFSPKWYIKQRGPTAGLYNENVHFGYGGHLAVVWTWAYSALKAAIRFCNDKDWERHREENAQKYFGNPIKRESFVKENVHRVKDYLPPPLDYDMDLQNISQAMLMEKTRQEEHCQAISESPPCIMAFVAGPEGQTDTKDKLGRYLAPWFSHEDGFVFERDLSHGFARKLGIAAVKENATMQFDFRNIIQPVQVLTVHSIKSYGEAWEGSAANFIISKKARKADRNATTGKDWIEVYNEVLSGVHNSKSTISYSTEMFFPLIEVGSDMKLEVKLVGGSKFKVTGMMLCSR
ncbi:hypothetical protein IV203_019169 [Nitzschia inconspicua]|uniref:Uncharacterized protein n=1 Tax=Nitzschia inconspicua TaxID=303405 RepID=A0A9K3LYM8_9STRA|nr:hypothetical protein IV203_019169 [Nitzschia inconspicua]